MNKRSIIFLFLFIALLIFGITVAAVLVGYGLPQPEWVQIGTLSDFPPSAEPYRLSNLDGFVVNTGEAFFVFNNHPPHPRFHDTCLIYWDSERDRFAEPCGGAAFSLVGKYLLGPSPRGMDSYTSKMEGNEVWVETTALIEGIAVP